MRSIFFSLVLLFSSSILFSQDYAPVKWEFSTKKLSETEYDLIFTAHIQSGWVVYSSKLDPEDGPFPTEFIFEKVPTGLQKVGNVRELTTNRKKAYDKIFEAEVIKFYKKATFKQKIKLQPSYTLCRLDHV